MQIERYYRVQIVAADLPSVISQLSLSGTELQNIEMIDLLTMNASLKHSCFAKTTKIILKNGGSCKVLNKEGNLWKIKMFWKRPVILFGVLAYMIAALLVPNRIFFVEITGNNKIPSRYILSKAEDCGVQFGTLASEIRSEELKNQLLESIPQLQWIGVSVSGCVANIHVKERSNLNEKMEVKAVSNIISIADGVITDQIVYDGSPLFQVGDAVKKGDVLVSGYVDCGLKFRACQANAEIFALTKRNYQFYSLFPYKQRGEIKNERTCYRFKIGKKVINFCNHSGIMDRDCVKMYSEDCWSFPGGFSLPVSVIKITFINHDVSYPTPIENDAPWLTQFARKYLDSVMVSGEILREDFLWKKTETGNHLTADYDCREMIGRVKYEGTIE